MLLHNGNKKALKSILYKSFNSIKKKTFQLFKSRLPVAVTSMFKPKTPK